MNSTITDVLVISSNIPSDLFLKVTSDGIIPIPKSFTSIPIDFVITVASPFSTFGHYASGNISSINIVSPCLYLTNSFSHTLSSFSLSTECIPYSGNVVRGTMTVESSALSGIEWFNNPDACACDPEEIVLWKRKESRNTKIVVSGTWNVNGSAMALSGESDPFDLFLYDDYFKIKRQNENDTISANMFSLARDEGLKNNTDNWTLFNGMMGNEVTDFNHFINYKIANFAEDNNFVDTLNYRIIKNVKGIFGETFPSYEISDIPDSVERLIDIGTIDKNVLFGHKCKCNMNFQLTECAVNCRACKKVKQVNNLGDILNSSDTVSAGVPILYKSKMAQNYTILYPTVQAGLSSYTLGSLTAQNIQEESDICFYTWNQTEQGNTIGNYLIFGNDFDNNTTLMYDDKEYFTDVLEENLTYNLQKMLKNE